jgi:hypothetical protein
MANKKSKKSDNSHLKEKLDLRRHFFRAYHAAPPRVLDCCHGDGVIWERLRSEFPVKSILGIDKKAGKNIIQADSLRFLRTFDLDYDIIDIDTYGSPWKHWREIIPKIKGPTTVFMTYGRPWIQADPVIAEFMGIPSQTPCSLLQKLGTIHISYCVAVSYNYGLNVVESIRCAHTHKIEYLGVRLERRE